MPAELLIKACDAVHQNEVKDLRGCYKKGYVVVIRPAGHKWGKEELNKEKFYIVRVKDAEPEDLVHLLDFHKIIVGSRYHATSDKLGVLVTSTDKDTAQSECLKKCRLIVQELSHFGITVNEADYSIRVEEETEVHTVARRRYKIDVSGIEDSLKKGIIEVSAKDLKIIDQRQ
ncbi:hypothetical protein DRN85_03715 [Methanosarcinales archaeon]|nr:MAG: hypothetical protein DRN85_03715 [Methanosarcinales archaeon]